MEGQSIVVEPVALASDARGFVRRTCPTCARTFKVAAGRAEEPVVQAVFVAALQHANVEELAGPPRRFCPYCGHGAAADAFLTPAQRRYIEARAKDVAGSLRWGMLRQLAHEGRRAPTFVPLRPGPDHAPSPPPEPDDLQTARALCCGEAIKLKPTWREPFYCHHCRARQG